MAPRSLAAQRSRALERRQTYLECRELLNRFVNAVGQRAPLEELDDLRVAAADWLRANPRNK